MVYGCGRPAPTLVRVQDPFHKLIFRATGSVQVKEQDVLAAAEAE